MAVYVALVPCAGAEDHARFLCTGEAAEEAPEVCQRFVRGAVLGVCRRDDQIERLIADGLIVGKAAVDHGFHLGADGVEVHRRRQHDHIRRLERVQHLCHIVLPDAHMAFGAAVAGSTGSDLLFRQPDLLHRMTAFCCAFQKFVAQHIGIAALAGAGADGKYLHGNTLSFFDVSIVAAKGMAINFAFWPFG